MTTRDIVDTFQEMYGATISATPVSTIAEAVMDKSIEGQSRMLDEVYPIIYLDCIVVKITAR
jgi:putative transposase